MHELLDSGSRDVRGVPISIVDERTFRSCASGIGTITDGIRRRREDTWSNQALPIDRVTRSSAR